VQSKLAAANHTSSDAERGHWPEDFSRAGSFVDRRKMCLQSPVRVGGGVGTIQFRRIRIRGRKKLFAEGIIC